ncbi:MAG: hypothetical protein GWP15_02100 [Nitrospirae bacterium]|nr:hypothetical protein [Nitrospirota bacterium]
MKNLYSKIKRSELIVHETKRKALKKFLLLLVIFFTYFGFISFRYGLEDGWRISLLTWTFFVLCTPIADAGFILDFPIRLLTKIRMIISELGVWVFAIGINIYFITKNPSIYDSISILKIFKQILLHPIPFWIIIFLSASGTFLSIKFGDELMDVISHWQCREHIKHKWKHHLIIFGFSFISVLLIYFYFLGELGLKI